jgi:hypothetical protein
MPIDSGDMSSVVAPRPRWSGADPDRPCGGAAESSMARVSMIAMSRCGRASSHSRFGRGSKVRSTRLRSASIWVVGASMICVSSCSTGSTARTPASTASGSTVASASEHSVASTSVRLLKVQADADLVEVSTRLMQLRLRLRWSARIPRTPSPRCLPHSPVSSVPPAAKPLSSTFARRS